MIDGNNDEPQGDVPAPPTESAPSAPSSTPPPQPPSSTGRSDGSATTADGASPPSSLLPPPPVDITPATTPSPQPNDQQQQQQQQQQQSQPQPQEQHQHLQQKQQAGGINWNFDDPEALQQHVSGDPDPLELLRTQDAALERSLSFPAVPPPPLAPSEPDEQSLLNMMASEVATGAGGRGPFDSPAVEQTGFFAAENDHGDSFAQAGQQQSPAATLATATTSTTATTTATMRPMGVVVGHSNASTEQRQDISQQRYDEGLPLIHDDDVDELVVDSKKEMDFFGSEPDSSSEVFAGMDQATTTQVEASPSPRGAPQRKSTEQAMASATHAFRPTEGVASGTSVVAAQASSELVAGKEDEETPAVLSVDGDDFFSQLGQQQPTQPAAQQPESVATTTTTTTTTKEEDMTAKWQAALSDDEFLDDDDEGFLPSDDEGLLPNDEPQASQPAPVAMTVPQRHQQQQQQQGWPGQQPQGSYTPQPNMYPPTQALRHTQSAYFPAPAPSAYNAFSPQAPQAQKPESFVDKKEGYISPYDLPDVIVPRLRGKPNNVGQTMGALPPPLRSSSTSGIPGGPPQAPAGTKPAMPARKQFFEELPIAPPKQRASSAMGRYAPGRAPGSLGSAPISTPAPASALLRPGSYNPYAHPQTQAQAPQQVQPPSWYSPAPQPSDSAHAPAPAPPATTASSRYSPALPQSQPMYAPPPATLAGGTIAHVPGAAPPPVQALPAPALATGRYAPRPAGPPQPSGHPQTSHAPPHPPVAQQRYATPPMPSPLSSPGAPARSPDQRRSSGEYSAALHSSRPGTAVGLPPPVMEAPGEEDGEGEKTGSLGGLESYHPPPPVGANRHLPGLHARSTSTPPPRQPPPPQSVAQRQFSPQKYAPRSTESSPEAFQPPPRAQTSSPGLGFGRPKIAQKPRDPYERPSSALAHSTVPDDFLSQHQHQHQHQHQQHQPQQQQQQQPSATAPLLESRRESMRLDFMPPDDESANDELKRWQGAPVFTWGLGGVVTMFPVRTQRFASNLHSTVIKCSPGPVKARPLKEFLRLPDHHDGFPGPVWTGSRPQNKSKKKDIIAYMDSRIETMDAGLMDIYDPAGRREAEEKCMLWKIVRIMVENDGAVEGSPEADAAVRKVLTPEIALAAESPEVSPSSLSGFVPMAGLSNMRPANAEAVDADAVRAFRRKLLSGDREGAVWFAADKRLWAHAFLIAGAVGKDMWKRVVEDFVKAEVKSLGEGSDSLAVLYATLSGNWEESADELIPPSARMGMPMLTSSQDQEQSLEQRLGKWRESLALILSNRSPGDQTSILALGRLLANYGWIAAAHIW